MTVGQRIKFYRERANMRQIDLARAVNSNQRTISRLEKDDVKSRTVLVRIARLFDAPDILTTAVRGSELMSNAMDMLGYTATTRADPLVNALKFELENLEQCLAGDGTTAIEVADRIANLAYALQLIIPTLDRSPEA